MSHFLESAPASYTNLYSYYPLKHNPVVISSLVTPLTLLFSSFSEKSFYELRLKKKVYIPANTLTLC